MVIEITMGQQTRREIEEYVLVMGSSAMHILPASARISERKPDTFCSRVCSREIPGSACILPFLKSSICWSHLR